VTPADSSKSIAHGALRAVELTGEKIMANQIYKVGDVITLPECKITGALSERVEVISIEEFGYLVRQLDDTNGEPSEFSVGWDLVTLYYW
jgi:hypothetical protein